MRMQHNSLKPGCIVLLGMMIVGLRVAVADDVPAPVTSGTGQSITGAAPPGPTTASFRAGPLNITFGGFIESTFLYRTRNETADVGSSFSGIPFPDSVNYYQPEFRASARATLLRALIEAPIDGANKVEGFFETDFLGTGVTSNSNESNSYVPRLRQAYMAWYRSDLNLYLLAGQSWRLATEFRNGLIPREENIPLTAEGSYVTGFNWTRQAQIRLVKGLGNQAFFGISLEGAQNLIKGTAPQGVDGNNPGGSLLNSTTTYSDDIGPDVIAKFAIDPGFGHYELYSLTRFFHDHGPSVPTVPTSAANHTTVAQSVGAGVILPLVGRYLEIQGTTLVGHGNGRYGAAQLGDSTYNTTNGSIAPLEEQQGLLRIVARPNPRLDAYIYAGAEHSHASYGLIPTNNIACNTNYVDLGGLPKTATCGAVGTVKELAAGFYFKFYRGPLGYLAAGPEVEYVKDKTYTGLDGSIGRTNDTLIFLTLRYFPFQ